MTFLFAVIQGQGLRPASRFLRGLALRPPSGRYGGAGRRLEDRERWGWGVGVRVGAEDEGEAVGDAQQVGFSWLSLSTTERARMSANGFNEWCSLSQASCQTCTLQHQHPGNSQHPWRQVTARGLYHRRRPHSSPQVVTVCPVGLKHLSRKNRNTELAL